MQRHLLSPGGKLSCWLLVFLIGNSTDKPFHPGVSTLDIYLWMCVGPHLCVCVAKMGSLASRGRPPEASSPYCNEPCHNLYTEAQAARLGHGGGWAVVLGLGEEP